MKVLIAVVLAIGSVSALGSGPYLPSGWKPQGPSFYLPSEVAKPSNGPQKANLIQETEASGSDALREYGPPKVDIIQFGVNQGLPEVSTEQTFLVQSLASQELQAGAEESVAVEANTEKAALFVEEVATTDAQLAQVAVEEQAIESLTEVQPTFEVVADIVEETSGAGQVEEATVAAVQEENIAPAAVYAEEEIVAPTVVAQEEAVVVEEAVVPTAAVEEVAVETVSGVNNIADALVKLENEVKAAEALAAVEVKAEVSGSLQQAPEGFLEYGPPGFREYGPPKAEDIARSAAVQVAPTSAFENNEVRRRRFSPKFRSAHKQH